MIVVKRTLLLLCLSSLGASASAVFFGTAIPNEQFHRITTDNNGNVYVGGTTSTPAGTDLLVASYTSAGLPRWNAAFDGGLGVNDSTDAINVHNANVNFAYHAGSTFGMQVIARTTGVLGVQTTYTPASPLSTNNTTCVLDTGIFVGSRNIAGVVDGFVLPLGGVNPPSPQYHGTSGYTVLLDSFSNAAGTYIIGNDRLGNFVAQWDFTTGTTIWKTNLPAGVHPVKIVADNAGNLYVGGTAFNATRDLTVCKYSSAGVLLGQGTADSSTDDTGTHLTVVGNKPVVAGYRTTPTGNNIYVATFQANLALALNFTDQPCAESGQLTTDGTAAYVIGRTANGTDSWLYKFNTIGVFWATPINVSPNIDTSYGLIYKSGMLLTCGWSNGDAFVSRIDTGLGGVLW